MRWRVRERERERRAAAAFGIIDSSDAAERRGEPTTLKSFAGGYISYELSAAANGTRYRRGYLLIYLFNEYK